MNHKNSLVFPDDAEMSEDAKNLICAFLTERLVQRKNNSEEFQTLHSFRQNVLPLASEWEKFQVGQKSGRDSRRILEQTINQDNNVGGLTSDVIKVTKLCCFTMNLLK